MVLVVELMLNFFNARIMHTTLRHQEDDLGNAF